MGGDFGVLLFYPPAQHESMVCEEYLLMLQSKQDVIFANCFSPFEVDDNIHKTRSLNKKLRLSFPLLLKIDGERMKCFFLLR